MKNKIVIGFIFMLLLIPVLSAVGIDQIKEYCEIETYEENTLEVSLQPGFLSRGVKIMFSNTGDSVLTNIEWCFITKPVFTAIVGKGDVCTQTIDELQPGEEKTIVLPKTLVGSLP